MSSTPVRHARSDTLSLESGVTRICGETILDGGRPWFSVQGPRGLVRAELERRIGFLEHRLAELTVEIERLRALTES